MSKETAFICHKSNENPQYPVDNRDYLGVSGAQRLKTRVYRLVGLLIALAAISLWIYWPNSATIFKEPSFIFDSTRGPQSLSKPTIQTENCSSVTASTTRSFEFNITTENSSSQGKWRFLERARDELRNNIRGSVSVNRGDFFQTSDIEVRVGMRSEDAKTFEQVHFNASRSMLSLDYTFDKSDTCTEIQVAVYLRPWPRRLIDFFGIESDSLDITFNKSLNWEVDSLVVQSTYRDFSYRDVESTESLTLRNVTITSYSGKIFGLLAASGNIKVGNIFGAVQIFLYKPKKRFPLESIIVGTIEGTISVQTFFRDWPPRPHNHTALVGSILGNVDAYIPHGSVTKIGSEGGNIRAWIKPFGTARPYEPSEFMTVSGGTSDVWLFGPEPRSRAGWFNPLMNMTSSHVVTYSNLSLLYSDKWYGNVAANFTEGKLQFDASEVEEIKREEGYMEARRGKDGESRLKVWVGEGDVDMKIGVF